MIEYPLFTPGCLRKLAFYPLCKKKGYGTEHKRQRRVMVTDEETMPHLPPRGQVRYTASYDIRLVNRGRLRYHATDTLECQGGE